jgi:hypothetical protein
MEILKSYFTLAKDIGRNKKLTLNVASDNQMKRCRIYSTMSGKACLKDHLRPRPIEHRSIKFSEPSGTFDKDRP